MDIEVGTLEAKNRLSELLSQVEKGQRVFITRRGKRVALLTSATTESEDTRRSDLMAEIREFRRSAKRGPESLRALIEEGRR